MRRARERRAPEVVLWGDGTPTREFLHVADAARAFRLALERLDGPEPLTSGRERRSASTTWRG
jgi:GDP-L-fucose synthase